MHGYKLKESQRKINQEERLASRSQGLKGIKANWNKKGSKKEKHRQSEGQRGGRRKKLTLAVPQAASVNDGLII